MTRKTFMRLASAVLGGLAVGLAFLAALLVLDSGGSLAGSTAVTSTGFLVPLLTGVVVAGVAWLLLAEDEPDRSVSSDRVARCAGCGRLVPTQRRLCPFCGAQEGAETKTVFASPSKESAL